MIVEIQDVNRKSMLIEDFQKLPLPGEIVKVPQGGDEYEVTDAPIRHECIHYCARWSWSPIVTVKPLNPSKTTKKTVKG